MKGILIIRTVLMCLSSLIFINANAKEIKNSYQARLFTSEHILNDFIPKNPEQEEKYQILLKNFIDGDSLFLKGEISRAATCYKNGLSITKELHLNWHTIVLNCRLGFAYYWSGNFIQSDLHYEASKKMIYGSSFIKDTIAVIETFVLSSQTGENQLNVFLKARNIENILSENLKHFSNNRQVKLLLLNAIALKNENKYHLVFQELNEAEQLLNPEEYGYSMYQFLIRLQQAYHYYYLSDFSLALEYMKDLSFLAKDNSEFDFLKYYLNYYIGLIYTNLQDYDNAKDQFISIGDLVKDRLHISYVDYHIHLGWVYSNLGYFSKAMHSYKLAEQILYENSIQDEELARLYWYLASLSGSMNNEKAELYYLNEAEKILQIYPDRFLETFVLRKLGDHYRKKEEYGLAVFTYNLILNDLDKLLKDDDYFKSQYYFLILSNYQYLLKHRAFAFYHLSKNKGFDLVTLKQSYQDFKDLLVLKMKLIDQLNFEQSKKASLYEIRRIYNDIINVGYDLYSKTGNDSIAYELFEFSEKGKAYLLKGFMSDEIAKRISGVPGNLIQKSKEYQKEIDSLQYNLKQREMGSDGKNDYAFNNILNRIEEYDHFIMKLEKDYPKYLKYKEENMGISINQIQNLLKPDQALLEYHYTFNAFYIFYIDESKFRLFISPVNRNFPEKVLSFRKLMAEMEYGDFSQKTIMDFTLQSNSFYKLFIEPVADLIENKRLIIIPDGELILLPFESLVKNESDTGNEIMPFKDLDYLLKSNPVSYMYSANQLFDDTRIRKRKIRFAGFAPNYRQEYSKGTGKKSRVNFLKFLPGAIEEVNSIEQYYRGKAYIGNDASKKNFFKESKKSEIIHLAMHTFLDTDEPMNSELIFSSENDSEKQLHAYEVYAQELTTKLMVLSACNTGTGEVVMGEGVFNIARAFIQAGVKNIILTQWSVADQSSVNLMDRFYFYLSKGHPVDIALQRSKIDFIMKGDPVKTQPFFWAPFVCYGNPTSLPERQYSWLIAIGSILGVTLILLVLKLRFKLF